MARRKTGKGPINSCTFAMVIYVIWRERNQLRFSNGVYDEDRISREIVLYVHTRGQDHSKWKKQLEELNAFP